MSTDKVPFALFEYDVVATVATGKIFIEPLIMSSLQNVAEFVAGVPIWGHQLESQLPLIAEEIKRQHPYFEKLDAEIRIKTHDNTLTRAWYYEKKKQYVSENGELIRLERMPYFELVDPFDTSDERNSFPEDENRIMKF